MKRLLFLLLFIPALAFGQKAVTYGGKVVTYSGKVVTYPAYCNEYQAVLDYWSGQGWDLPDIATTEAFNTMVETIVDGGVWAKGEFFDFFSTHNQNCAKTNWFHPGTFNPSEVNAPAWTQYQGYTGNSATVRYLRSNFIPSVDGTLIGQNNICDIIGIGTNSISTNFDFGAISSTSRRLAFISLWNATTAYFYCNNSSVAQANNNSKKYFAASRNNGANFDAYQNLVKTNVVKASDTLTSHEIYICGANTTGIPYISERQLRFAALFSYLTETEVGIVINAIETCLDALGTGLI